MAEINKIVPIEVLEKAISDKIRLEQKFLEKSENLKDTYHITGKIQMCQEFLELIRGFRYKKFEMIKNGK